jgi:hypothetical protein
MAAAASVHTLEGGYGQAGRPHEGEEAAFQPALDAGVEQHIVEQRHAGDAAAPALGECLVHEVRRGQPEADGVVEGVGGLDPIAEPSDLEDGQRRAHTRQAVHRAAFDRTGCCAGSHDAGRRSASLRSGYDELERRRRGDVHAEKQQRRPAGDERRRSKVEHSGL